MKAEIKTIYSVCPYCKKTAQRVGAYLEGELIGITGLDCKLCLRFEKPNLNKFQPLKPPGIKAEKQKKKKIRVWHSG